MNQQNHNDEINNNHQNILSKSQSDVSDDLEEVQYTDKSKLTHIKKAKQTNKRPPSFRSKNKVFKTLFTV
jgi:hypothetical protein